MSTIVWTASQKEMILSLAKAVFFRAMLDGYAGKTSQKSTKIKTPDGYRTITYQEDDFQVVDRYCVTPQSDYSAGTTTILFRDSAVWWMSYGGRYLEEIIPFLKQALASAYHKREFHGGRGPSMLVEEELFYQNNVEPGSTFREFSGYEKVGYIDGDVLGHHRYFGLSLI